MTIKFQTAFSIVFGFAITSLTGCTGDDASQTEQEVDVPLDPLTIPRFAHELPIPRTFAPTVSYEEYDDDDDDHDGHHGNGHGDHDDHDGHDGHDHHHGGGHHHHTRLVHEYTVTAAQTEAQMLPPGYPATKILAYGGMVKIPGSTATEFVRSSPGPIFDNIRGTPSRVHWRNEITGPHILPIDPTLSWANPSTLEPPTAPFDPFPSGYEAAQSPVGMVSHNHGLMVVPQNDGTAEEWFTAQFHRGPSYETRDYLMPNEQPGTQLFYHDHVMGMTRVSLYAGMVGAAYYIRDPNTVLDGPSSPLPKGKYEIPLIIFDRAFNTNGQLRFPLASTNKKNAYWQAGDGADTILVNGKVWPNLNVERRQYRFRTLAIGNGRSFTLALDNSGVNVPFTLIGSDGGYYPAPQQVTSVQIGTTERADIVVDFSQFPAGTQIILRNVGATPVDTVGTVMRFTVIDSEAVPPVAIPTTLVPRTQLVADAPVRIKTLHNHIDIDGDAQRSVDGLDFSAPTSEFPLLGSTEQWNIVNLGGGGHLIHLHLIEFQVVERQAINTAAYLQRWHLLNGHRPVSRPIVVDPTPFFVGAPIPATAYESGWKDTIRSNANQVVKILARWAPQETPTNGVGPNQNKFPIEPVNPKTDQWYLWHCHILGHEDNDMMRKLPMVYSWDDDKKYESGTVVEYNGVNYRARTSHYAQKHKAPNTRFDQWERVNNNDGTWQPQIIYALGDRVLYNNLLYRSRFVHQALPGQTPDVETFAWDALPMTACGQIERLCADNTQPKAVTCQGVAAAGTESACLTNLDGCLAQCDEEVRSPCSGLCNAPTPFTVADGTTFNSGPLGQGAACFETESEIASGSCTGLGNRKLTINGREIKCNGGRWDYPLPTQRNHGYCIQTTAGHGHSNASFKAW